MLYRDVQNLIDFTVAGLQGGEGLKQTWRFSLANVIFRNLFRPGTYLYVS